MMLLHSKENSKKKEEISLVPGSLGVLDNSWGNYEENNNIYLKNCCNHAMNFFKLVD